MKLASLQKKLLGGLTAAALGTTIAFTAVPVPTAAAGWGSVIGAIAGDAAQYNAATKQINYYDNDGREEFFQDLKNKYGVNDDADLNNRLAGIMGSLSSAIAAVDPSINDKPYNYFINTDTTFNAFCSLGHNMSVNTGLFSLIDNDDEIAVVLGHEMGHGQKNHVAKSYVKQLRVNILADIIAGSSGQTMGAVFANYANATQVTKPQEWEADNLAFDYITHSSYNPGACAAIWQRVIEKQGGNNQNFAGEIFSPSDHPSNEQRRDNYAQKLREYSGNKITVKNGLVQVNGKDFVTPAASDTMSGPERAYFVAGNLAAFCHSHTALPTAYVQDGTVMLGDQSIITPNGSDESAETLAARLNNIK